MIEGVNAAEVTLLVALIGVWSLALMMIAGVIIRDIVRAWRGTDAHEELTVEWQPVVGQERWDLAAGGGKDDVRPLREPTELQAATGMGGE